MSLSGKTVKWHKKDDYSKDDNKKKKCRNDWNQSTFSTVGKIFRGQHFEIFLLFCPENRIWHFIQIVCQILFPGKIKKKNISLSFAE